MVQKSSRSGLCIFRLSSLLPIGLRLREYPEIIDDMFLLLEHRAGLGGEGSHLNVAVAADIIHAGSYSIVESFSELSKSGDRDKLSDIRF
jgi:hypothetical protein